MAYYPPSMSAERRDLAVRVQRLVARLEAMGCQPTDYEGKRLMKGLGLLSAGDLDEAKRAIVDAERANLFIRDRRSVVSLSPITTTQLRQRLAAVMQDIGL